MGFEGICWFEAHVGSYIDQSMVVQKLRGFHHGSVCRNGRRSHELIICPKRRPQKPHIADCRGGIHQEMDAQLGRKRPRFIGLLRNQPAVPFVISGNVNHRTAIGPIGKPASRIRCHMDVSCRYKDIKFWPGIGQIPVALLNVKVAQDPKPHVTTRLFLKVVNPQPVK